jgi:gliding motility-associated-like protein
MKHILTFLLLLFPFIGYTQCDVFIEPGSVVVTDNGSGVKFNFDVTNNSSIEWGGDVLKLYWTLNSSAPIWEIDYNNNNSVGPIQPGETRNITTPWFDIPNLPSWFPDDPTTAQPWEESMEWPYYGLSFPFQGAWSPMNLRLGSCGLADGAWVYGSDGELYYGPFNSECPDVNNDAMCDCNVDFLGFDPVTYDVSIEIISHWNCGTSLNTTGLSSEMDHVNMIQVGAHILGWDYQWGCTAAEYHLGWTFDDPVSFVEYYAGDVINYNLFLDNSPFDDCFQEILESDTLSSCLEIVLWQINSSETAIIGEIDGGWAATCGTCSNQTQFYPDMSMDLNSVNVCEAPPPLYPGCMDPEAENYDPIAGYDNGTCTYPPVLGCQDPIACNYNESATENYGCVYCDTPDGEELCNEYHGEGSNYWEFYSNIFDCDPIEGCTDPDAINYNEEAETDDGSCEYSPDAFPGVGFNGTICDNGEPANIWNITVYNPDTGGFNATDTLFVYCVEILEIGFDECQNGYEAGQYWMPPGEGQFVATVVVPESISTFTVNVYYAEGEYEGYVSNNQVIIQNIIQDPGVCVVLGCTDPEANNYDQFATEDDGSCEYDITELTYVGAECYVDCDLSGPFYYVITTWTNTGNVEITNFCAEWDVLGGPGDIQECYNGSLMPGDTTLLTFGPYSTNGSPVAWAYLQVINGVELVPQIENYETLYCYGDAEVSCVYGCTDQEANNYDSTADLDDGSCTYDIFGCTDPEANNYNPDANIDNGSCTYDVLGCTDSSALNYNPLANVDDGSCEYDVFGCTDPNATNYNPLATVDDGSCEYVIYLGGCTDPEAINYNDAATYDDGSCVYDPCSGILGAVYYAPNTFTPNNDGANDGWTVVTDPGCWLEWHVLIYSRWGQLIWESYTPGEIWPGSYFDGNYYVADGVYFYKITGVGYNPANTFQTTGNITIFR